MIELISNSSRLRNVFEECMDKYMHYDWIVAWMGTPDILYEKLLKNKDKIRTIATGLYGINKEPVTEATVIHDLLGLKDEYGKSKTFFIKKRGPKDHFILHSKLYYFENSDFDWKLIVGSANFSDSAFADGKNIESVLVCDQDSYSNEDIKKFISAIRLENNTFSGSIIHYRYEQIERYLKLTEQYEAH